MPVSFLQFLPCLAANQRASDGESQSGAQLCHGLQDAGDEALHLVGRAGHGDVEVIDKVAGHADDHDELAGEGIPPEIGVQLVAREDEDADDGEDLAHCYDPFGGHPSVHGAQGEHGDQGYDGDGEEFEGSPHLRLALHTYEELTAVQENDEEAGIGEAGYEGDGSEVVV